MKIAYRAAALEEVREAVAWYLSEAGQLQAEAFHHELNAKVALLMAHPGIGTPGENGTRWMPLKVFPTPCITGSMARCFVYSHWLIKDVALAIG